MNSRQPETCDLVEAPDFHQPAAEGVDAATPQPRILVAGIGNVFLRDDGFGCSVVQALSRCQLPGEVQVRDFAIRSYDLAYALMDGYEAVILVDAVSQEAPPGTLFLIAPQLERTGEASLCLNAHAMDPLAVIDLAQSLGGIKAKVYLVGCQPAVLDSEDGLMGLSDQVRGVVPQAVNMIERLVSELLDKNATHAGTTPVERRST